VKAMMAHAFGPPGVLQYQDCPSPVPGAGEVLVGIQASGVNFTDLLALEGRSQLQRRLPFIPGCEGAGVVLACGAGVKRLAPGDRVLGCKADGCYAEEVLFAENELTVIPAAMDMRHAATFYIASFTARYALQDRARLKAGENLLVLAAGGGVGLVSIDIGKALGAYVVAAASSDEKLALARVHGADALVRYERGPLDLAAQKKFASDLLQAARLATPNPLPIGAINSLPADAGYHVIIDGIGGSYAEPAVRSLAWEGRYLSVGFAAGLPKVALGPLLFKNGDIMGIQPSSDQHRLPGLNPGPMQILFDWYRQGRMRPHITQELHLRDGASALTQLADRTANGRIVLLTDRYRR
jgi:NADPH2:quinone reductase